MTFSFLLSVHLVAVKTRVSSSDDEFDWAKKSAPKQKAVVSDDDSSFAPEPSSKADSDMDFLPPAPKAPEPT